MNIPSSRLTPDGPNGRRKTLARRVNMPKRKTPFQQGQQKRKGTVFRRAAQPAAQPALQPAARPDMRPSPTARTTQTIRNLLFIHPLCKDYRSLEELDMKQHIDRLPRAGKDNALPLTRGKLKGHGKSESVARLGPSSARSSTERDPSTKPAPTKPEQPAASTRKSPRSALRQERPR
jgi:hypothetical protein